MAGSKVWLAVKGSRRKKRSTKRVVAVVPQRKYAASQNMSNFKGRGVKQFATQRPVIQRGPNPFPREYHVRLNYQHWTGFTSPATTLAGSINFRMNSLFDSDQSGVGHQSYQFDQLTPLYRKAIVYGCKINLRWSNPSADGVYVGYCLTGNNMAGAGGKALDYIKEMPYTQMTVMNDTGSQVRNQSLYVDIAKYFNVTRKQLFADEDNNMELTAGPAIARNCLLQLLIVTPDGAAKSVDVEISLTYYAKLYGLRDPGQS